MNRENRNRRENQGADTEFFGAKWLLNFLFSESNAEVNRKGDRMARAKDRVPYERSHQNETRRSRDRSPEESGVALPMLHPMREQRERNREREAETRRSRREWQS
jgi:hypothetical protein